MGATLTFLILVGGTFLLKTTSTYSRLLLIFDVKKHNRPQAVWVKEFIHSADKLLADGNLRQFYGNNARQYAEQNFDIGRITDQFKNILLH